jgi:hypothetical protein
MSELARSAEWYRDLMQRFIDGGPPERLLALLDGDLNARVRPDGALTVLGYAMPRYTPDTSIGIALALLRAGADPVNAGEGPSIFLRALASGLPELVRAVVDAGGAKGIQLTPPQKLMFAACLGDAAEVKRLLASGKLKANAFKGNTNGSGHGFITPLVAAARGGFSDVARALVRAGCPPTWGAGKWSTHSAPAAQAARFGHGELARELGGVSDEVLAFAAHAGGHVELARTFDPAIDERVRAAAARLTPPANLLEAWRDELARLRQPWPEWAELEAIAGEPWTQDGFVLVHASRALSIDRRPKTPANGRPWLAALAGLRPSREPSGHPLFGIVDFGSVTRASKSFWPDLEHVDAIPSGCVALTSTAAGHPVLTRGDDVLVLRGRELVRLASVEVFVRYALHCVLNEKDWWLDGLRKGFARDRYDLADVTLLD